MFTQLKIPKVFYLIALAAFTFMYTQCSPNLSSINQHAFYYWETEFDLDSNDQQYLKSLEVNKLYLRFFDVDFESQAIPVGPVRFESKIPSNLEIVPVVFITNKTISMLDTMGIRDLSQKITTRLKREITRTQIEKQVNEIQIDCDWTITTRDKYFYLLNLLQNELNYDLSVTIRLHQYKYHKHNVPPVKKGMLMCYNINPPDKFEVPNSLFNKEEVMSYVQNVQYPLPLDLAMPTFSWGVVFDESKKFLGLSHGMRLKEVKADTNFAATDKSNVFLVKHDSYNYHRYLSQGSLVRIEECGLEEVKQVLAFLKNHLNQTNATLSLYHFNSLKPSHENQEQIHLLYNAAH